MDFRHLVYKINSQRKFIVLTLIIFSFLNLQGCTTKVVPNTEDSTAPKVALLVVSKNKLTNVTSDDTPKTVNVSSGSEIQVLFNASDPEGAKYSKLIIVHGGLFRSHEGGLSSDYIQENVLSNGQSETMAMATGIIVPDTPTNQIVLRVEGGDWAGNISTTPTITIYQLPAPVARISASSDRIAYGQPVTITYETENADEALINDEPQSTLNGTKTYTPTTTTGYTLRARNGVATTTDHVVVRVIPRPTDPVIDFFRADYARVERGDRVTISWETSNASVINLYQNNNRIVSDGLLDGSETVTLNTVGTQSFRLDASTNNDTQTSATTEVTVVNSPPPGPTCFRTNGSFARFLLIDSNDTASLWRMDLSNYTTSGAITTVRNHTGRDFDLEIGTRLNRLGAGDTSSAYSGIDVTTLYSALFFHGGTYPPLSVDIEVCYE